ncbi:MAG: hypothetical protein KC636_14625, partial [Myxococcales bacterium]|nr:hypothetical protein [Myxococcales bacterium]
MITAALACGGGSGDTEDTEGGGPSGVGLTSTSTDGTAGTSSDTGASTGMGTDASGSGSDGTSGSGSAGSTGVKFDIGMESTSGSTSDTEGEGEGCKKVDLLFVIDNSGSMEDEQVNLINSFPGFINQIQT